MPPEDSITVSSRRLGLSPWRGPLRRSACEHVEPARLEPALAQGRGSRAVLGQLRPSASAGPTRASAPVSSSGRSAAHWATIAST